MMFRLDCALGDPDYQPDGSSRLLDREAISASVAAPREEIEDERSR